MGGWGIKNDMVQAMYSQVPSSEHPRGLGRGGKQEPWIWFQQPAASNKVGNEQAVVVVCSFSFLACFACKRRTLAGGWLAALPALSGGKPATLGRIWASPPGRAKA